MRVVGVGDNTVDIYLNLGVMFPGGNAVNVPVFAKRLGAQASYIGWIGDDERGKLIHDALMDEGVDLSHTRQVEGENAFCEIDVIDGDRVFGNYSEGVRNQIQLKDSDYEFIADHDLTHTSVYSCIEPAIEKLHKASNVLSFDFSQDWDEDYLERMLPHVDIAILSSKEKTLEDNQLLFHHAKSLGPDLILITGGKQGAILFDGIEFFHQGIYEAPSIADTLGAGDAFAAQFLVNYLDGKSIKESLNSAAKFAAVACQTHGAFGHGVPI